MKYFFLAWECKDASVSMHILLQLYCHGYLSSWIHFVLMIPDLSVFDYLQVVSLHIAGLEINLCWYSTLSLISSFGDPSDIGFPASFFSDRCCLTAAGALERTSVSLPVCPFGLRIPHCQHHVISRFFFDSTGGQVHGRCVWRHHPSIRICKGGSFKQMPSLASGAYLQMTHATGTWWLPLIALIHTLRSTQAMKKCDTQVVSSICILTKQVAEGSADPGSTGFGGSLPFLGCRLSPPPTE